MVWPIVRAINDIRRNSGTTIVDARGFETANGRTTVTDTSAPSPISCDIPLDRDGKFHGYLMLPVSRDDSAWGSVMIPITVVQNGVGPTALLTGANHGDEYEGPIALQDLAYSLNPEDISGRVIIVPFMNKPAFDASCRVSPLDGVNMNRCFPGSPTGSPTEKIADYFLTFLVPLADLVLDFHSGGKSLDFIPFAAAHKLEAPAQQAACVAAMSAFNAPYSMILREIDNVGMYDTAVENAGKIFVSTELGGGGTASGASSGIAKRGVLNVLKHMGIVSGAPELAQSIALDTSADGCVHVARTAGLIEFGVDLGQPVASGDTLARIWPVDRSGGAPVEVVAQTSGLLAARHFPGLIKLGDCLAVVAQFAPE